MPNTPVTQTQLLAENDALRVRLAQAEESLREMRSGEVDALVISDVGGAQLFTLKDADQSFRLLVEKMSEGALTMTAQGVIVYANRSFAGLLKTPLEKVMGSAVRTWIAPDSQPILQSLLSKGAGEERHAELVLVASDGTRVPVYLSVSNLPLEGSPDAYCLVAIDLTEHNRMEAIAASERVARELLAAANQSRGELLRVIEDKTRAEAALRRFGSAMDATADAIYLVDRKTMRFTHVNEAACRMQSATREELMTLGPVALLATSRAELERTYDAIIASGVDAEPLELLRQRKDGSQVWIELRRHAQRSGERWTMITLVRDITERKHAERELRESRQRLDGIVTSAMDAIVTVDEEQCIVLANPAAERMFGYTAAEFRGQPLDLLMPERFRAEHSAHIAAFGKAGVTSRRMGALRPVSGVRKNGEEFLIEASISKDESTGRRFFTAILRDITERKAAENRVAYLNRVYAILSGINTLIVRVREREELFHQACRIAVEEGGFRLAWIGLVDRDTMELIPIVSAGTTQDASQLVNQRFSLLEDAPLGNALCARAIREKIPVFSNNVPNDPNIVFKEEHVKRGSRSLLILPLQVSGEVVGVFALYAGEIEFFQEEEIKLLTELAGDVAFAMDHIGKQERLHYLAYYDELTGLANRSLFLERVAQYMRSAHSGAHKLAVFLIDIERFKNINDSMGRPAGDELLRQAGEWLSRNAGDANLLARIGADHFAGVLPQVAQGGDVVRLLEKTMEAFQNHLFHLNDSVYRIAAKVGVAVFPDDGADAETLFKHAEAALKKAKASGERYLFYTQNMTELVAGKVTMENQLRQALENEEFVLHYQPKVNLATGKMTGAEALIRWNDPRTGLVPPGHFIPILEETGLIHDVGRWALRQAIADYLRWRASGLAAVRIAVNVSPLQLRNRDFIAEVREAIGVDEQAAAGLEIEITESVIMADVKHSITSLQAIRAMGVSIAIDDFGTGFSSLAYLARLPVDTLKIDRSFVIDMTAGPQGLALVSTIINLAHALKLKVVAEGVETEEQSSLLRLLGCDEMQGFLFSKAVPGDIFEARFLSPTPAG